MDTYIPTGSASTILGGTGGDGELDGIQAFKKGMKEKENRDNAGTLSGSGQKETPNSDVSTTFSGLASHSDPPLDEIQLFKLMMKREEEKKRSETMKDSQMETKQISGISTPDTPDSAVFKGAFLLPVIWFPDLLSTAIVQRASLASFTNDSPVTSSVVSNGITRSPLTPLIDGSHEGSRPPLPAQPQNSGSTPAQTPTTDYLQDRPNSSRLFCATISSETHPPAPLTTERSPDDASSPNASSSSQFNPPPGSRLLALGARAPPKPQPQISQSPNGLQPLSHASQVNTSAYQSGSQTPLSQSSHVSLKSPLSDTSHAQQGFSPFGDPSQSSVTPKEQSDPISYQNTLDALRRPSGMERPSFDAGAASSESFTTPTYPLNGQGSFNDVNGAGYAAGKGSRFAKFFDGKSRDGSQYGGSKGVGPPGFPSSSPAPSQRQEAGGFQHGGIIGNADTRSMNEIYTMLSNSAQVGLFLSNDRIK
jgi:zinc finger CCCH domain-containing protein 13